MNNIKRVVLLVMCLLLFCSCPLVCASPGAPQNGSLTLFYEYEKQPCEGLTIQTYQIAYRTQNGTFELTRRFADYPVSIYEISSQTEWKWIASTLVGYVAADQLKPDFVAVTDSSGSVCFDGADDGLYLTLAVACQKNETTITFNEFITNLPQVQSDGSENYCVSAVPKYTSYTPPKTEYKVVKQWKDSGNVSDRPKTVTVDIYNNGKRMETCVLSEENQWCYRWQSSDATDRFCVVERLIDAQYKVTIEQKETTFVLTNTSSASPPSVPETGEKGLLFPIILLSGASAFSLLLLRKVKRSRE